MKKITFSLFAALGLILASMLLPAVNAFAITPTCSSGCYLSGCTCICSGPTQNSIPMTLSNSSVSHTLPFNDVDPNNTHHQTLPATVTGSSNPNATCSNGCACISGTCPSLDACNICGGGVSSCSGSCTNSSGCTNGALTCSGDSCVCSGGSSNPGCGCGQPAPVCGVCGGCTGGQICCSGACHAPSCDGTCDGAVNAGCGCGQPAPVCGACGGCTGSQTCVSGSCCTPTTCTAPCGTTAGTNNCGQACTATLTDCSCPLSRSYTVAPVVANTTNGQSTVWCYTSGTTTSVTENESGCGNPGTPSTACNPAITLNCLTACATCSVECTPVCPIRSCTTSTGNCGQACPITCNYGRWSCDDTNTCVLTPITPPSSCFVAGTKVLLANGKETPIERLKAGDILLGSGGIHNKVIKLQIDPKKDWKVYAFNGGRYFVTRNHVFQTTTGWAAINPTSALRENPQLKIRKLKIGDVLITLKGSMRIEKITSKIIKHSVVYSPELDGDHEYYADGFLVHNLLYNPTDSGL